MGHKEYKTTLVVDRDLQQDIILEKASDYLNEVVIKTTKKAELKSEVKNVLTGVNRISSEEIKKLPVFLGESDVTKMILTQTGVSSSGEGSAGFNIRGGNVDQNLILFDGAQTFNSSHVFGFFSAFNPDAIDNIKLYKGGIPARYGGRGSSILEINQKNGLDSISGEGGISFLFSRLTLRGPIKKGKADFLVGIRRSYLDIFFPLFDKLKDNKLYFQDLNGKVNWDINKHHKLSFSGYNSVDMFKIKTSESNTGNTTIELPLRNLAFIVNWHYKKNLFTAKNAISFSRFNYEFNVQSETNGNAPSGVGSGSNEISYHINTWTTKSDLTYNLNSHQDLNFGAQAHYNQFSPGKLVNNGTSTIDGETEKTINPGVYFEVSTKYDKFNMNLGLRSWYLANIGKKSVYIYQEGVEKTVSSIVDTIHYGSGKIIKDYFNIEPRVSLSYFVSPNSTIKLGYNRIFQNMHLISNTTSFLPFDTWRPSGYYIKPLEVNQISIGFNHDLPDKSYTFSLESYYKKFDNLLEYKGSADLFLNEHIETEIVSAEGYSYGLEIAAHKNNGKLTGFINYTFSSTKRRTTSSIAEEQINDNNYFSSNFDRPHILNISANYKIGPKTELSAFFTYQTGRPITVPTGYYNHSYTSTNTGSTFYTYSDRNAYRIGSTHRLDLSVTFHKTKIKKRKSTYKKRKRSWVIGAYNVYARKNPYTVYASTENSNLKLYQTSIIGSIVPYVTYNFKF